MKWQELPNAITPVLISLISIAVVEKISALETEQFFIERAKQTDMDTFRKILFRPEGEIPRSGDELS
jgi:hypothetical protein